MSSQSICPNLSTGSSKGSGSAGEMRNIFVFIFFNFFVVNKQSGKLVVCVFGHFLLNMGTGLIWFEARD
jgi:hypothetical protein